MSVQEVRYELKRMVRRYQAIRLAEALLLATAAGLVTFAVLNLFTQPSLAAGLALTTAAGTAAVRILQLRLFRIDVHSMVRYVNRQLPQLQESGDLLLRDTGDLSLLEQLQQLRTVEQFSELRNTVSLPHRLLSSALVLIAGGTISGIVMLSVDNNTIRTHTGHDAYRKEPVESPVLPAAIKQLDIVVSPPAYTQIAEQTIHSFPIVAPENSHASWTIEFSGPVLDASIIFDGKDTVMLRVDKVQASSPAVPYTAARKLITTGFYQVMWQTAEGERKHTDFFPIHVRNDAPPTLKIDNLEQFIQVEPAPRLSVDMKATLVDDYGLTDAYIVATVSKGSGEGIKFREERLRFDSPASVRGRKVPAARHIDLIKLGLDPGDELYYYIEAFDNKQPKSNRARTETYFISVKDTASISTSVDPGLGVDLMPEYFRSQRQIIIDSEKLLREKKQLSREKFNSRSNDLAHDEKVLRLRYGEFLGEEFESSIGPAAGPESPVGSDADVMKQYGHQHDTDEEHAARAEEPSKATKEAHHDHDDGDGAEDPTKAYLHAHDSEEEATFFTQSIRAKLKAAITIMWDAELHLRLYTPEKSLPYQYQALKLLKEISQDSRIYVHRTGFDPPPLKEDKRLSGDLAEAKGTAANTQTVVNDEYPAIRRALHWLEGVDPDTLTPVSRELLLQAGTEMATAALRQPGHYLKALSLLRAYTENELPRAERSKALIAIREALYQILPAKAQNPASRNRTTHPLDDAFIRNYDALPKELSQ